MCSWSIRYNSSFRAWTQTHTSLITWYSSVTSIGYVFARESQSKSTWSCCTPCIPYHYHENFCEVFICERSLVASSVLDLSHSLSSWWFFLIFASIATYIAATQTQWSISDSSDTFPRINELPDCTQILTKFVKGGVVQLYDQIGPATEQFLLLKYSRMDYEKMLLWSHNHAELIHFTKWVHQTGQAHRHNHGKLFDAVTSFNRCDPYLRQQHPC